MDITRHFPERNHGECPGESVEMLEDCDCHEIHLASSGNLSI